VHDQHEQCGGGGVVGDVEHRLERWPTLQDRGHGERRDRHPQRVPGGQQQDGDHHGRVVERELLGGLAAAHGDARQVPRCGHHQQADDEHDRRQVQQHALVRDDGSGPVQQRPGAQLQEQAEPHHQQDEPAQ
jgi:hypothetical protein